MLRIYATNGTQSVDLVNLSGDDLEGRGTWEFAQADLNSFVGSSVTLVFELDANTGSEAVYIDNVRFSSETNEPPTATGDSDQTSEGQPVTTDVLANDTDPDGSLDPSTVQVEAAPSNGTTTVNTGGTITYAPDGGFSGTDSYTYTVADNDGATSNAATVTITVSALVPRRRAFRLARPCPPWARR